MEQRSFEAVLMSGHKQDAVELPFDPGQAWDAKAVPIATGRRGIRVTGRLNDTPFDSWVVARSKRHYVVVDKALRERAGIAVGDLVSMVLATVDHP